MRKELFLHPSYNARSPFALKKIGLHKVKERDMLQSFLLDPERPGGTVYLDPQEWRPILQA